MFSISEGTHRPASCAHESCDRLDCSLDGMISVGTQRPSSVPFSLQQLGNRTMGWVGPGSHDRLHAPVLVPSMGLKHGTQRSNTAHVDCVSWLCSEATWGMARFRQRPSAPSSDAQVGGM